MDGDFELVAKFSGNLWRAAIDHSPLDVVAWHGNYAPYKYDLRRFNTIGSTSFDHPDPSIFLVLQSQSDTPGVDNDRLRHLSAAMAGYGKHVSPAVVPSQRRQRVHGPDPRRLRREGGRLCARRSEPAQLHERPWARRRDVRARVEGRHHETTQVADTMAFMFETRAVIHPDDARARIGATAARLLPMLAICRNNSIPQAGLGVPMRPLREHHCRNAMDGWRSFVSIGRSE